VSDSNVRMERLPNGLTIVAEPMSALRSVAMTLLIPAGAIYDPMSKQGRSSMLAEWLPRGAGSRDSAELLEQLDALGVSHQQSASVSHISVSAAMLGTSLEPTLEIMADMVRRPHLGAESLEPIQALAIQSLQSLEDDPASLAMTHLRRHYFGEPWGRFAGGTPEGIESITVEDIKEAHSQLIQPENAILAVAGSLDFDRLREKVLQEFGNWEPHPVAMPAVQSPQKSAFHIPKETNQCQITMAFPSVDINEADYYEARAALAILGGYSSARLFTEVREKRGLCYTVYAGYEAFYRKAAAMIYAGTGADRAQETLDVTFTELARIKKHGVTEEELEMMKAGLISGLVMQQESSLSRSASLAGDYYHLGRVRSLNEIRNALGRLTAADVSRHVAEIDLDSLTILTLGPQPLKIS
jgi:predicted Zn-dependent peptidase